jgi:multimeric flavodoxin WrbA
MATTKSPRVRKGQGDWPLPRTEVERRFQEQYFDTTFEPVREQVDRLGETVWSNYEASRKSPSTRKAGSEFADAEHELPVEWLAARDAVNRAAREHDDASLPSKVLLISAASRNDKTCPGEMSKTFRLVTAAQEAFVQSDVAVDLLDLSALASDYRRIIHPCKACVSTAMPLCHWPCSCYPNHALGQVNDWMNEIYPRWVAAHGVMIVTPVYWYQVPAGLKSMMDRLVCADGGNPDPTTTHGKNVEEAKALELESWQYPRHLAGRAFGLVVHGDAAGADTVRRSLADWLTDMKLVSAGNQSAIDRYVGYYEPYATSHDALDAEPALFEETRNVARSLVRKMTEIRAGQREPELDDPRPK